MRERKGASQRWIYAIAILPVLFGIVVSAFVIRKAGPTLYPELIADAYHEEQHHLTVPGAREIKLTRTGAYGIYFEKSAVPVVTDSQGKIPPQIDCSLKSKSTGALVEAVPDYVETNRYWYKGQDRYGVLIMSVTVPQPGTYTFACSYKDGRTEPEILVALGPNYVWEFFKVAGRIAASSFLGLTTLCGSTLIGLGVVVFIATRSLGRKKAAG